MRQSSLINRFFNRLLVAALFFSAPSLFAGSEPYDMSKEAPPPPPSLGAIRLRPSRSELGFPDGLPVSQAIPESGGWSTT